MIEREHKRLTRRVLLGVGVAATIEVAKRIFQDRVFANPQETASGVPVVTPQSNEQVGPTPPPQPMEDTNNPEQIQPVPMPFPNPVPSPTSESGFNFQVLHLNTAYLNYNGLSR